VVTGFAQHGHFDFYMCTWDGAAHDRVQRPFARLLYPSACNDSPLRFTGTCDRWQLCTDAKGETPAPKPVPDGRLYLKIWDDTADYWFRLNFAGWRLPVYFQLPPLRSTMTEPWKFQVLYTGQDDDGKSWFTVRTASHYHCGSALELYGELERLKKEGKKLTYRRTTTIPQSEFRTQIDRGKFWADKVVAIGSAKSPKGTHYLVGCEWWKYQDNGWTYWVEQVNWGLVTLHDNAYDGKEASNRGADGEPGTWDDEPADYGDCISTVRKANRGLYQKLLTK